jgi:pSer/pThr/pTyr-binding forkhead associated (FHA) protein
LRLRVVEPVGQAGQVFELADELTVGRAAGCGVALEHDTFASKVHARLYRQDGRLWIEDLGSTNGTFLNTHRLDGPCELRRGDRLQVGETVLEVSK